MKSKWAVVLLSVCCLFVPLLESSFAQETIPLEHAEKQGKAKVEITGAGGSSGDAILILIQRKVPELLRLTLTPGTIFRSASGKVQNMVGLSLKGELLGASSYRPAAEIVLADNGKHTYIIEAYCLDFHKDNPGLDDRFTLSPPEDRATKILLAGQRSRASIQVIQSALWIDRDRTTAADLKSRFPVTDTDIEAARALLQTLGEAQPTGKKVKGKK